MSKEISTLQNWLKSGCSAVIAIVAKTWGSAPRRAGSIMVVRDDGVFEGSVSGGCVEGSVIAEAISLMATSVSPHASKTLTFAVASEQAWEVGLACGGEIEIFLFHLSAHDLPAINELTQSLNTRNPVNFCLPLKQGSLKISPSADKSGKATPIRSDESFIVPVIAPIQLDIVGAVHIAQHLAVMADECSFRVRIVDPRSAFAENRSFGDATLFSDWPDDFFRTHKPDATTAVVTLTHDPKLDDAALQQTLNSNAFYIGCLGSKKTHKARVERLKHAGFTKQQIEKISAPVGLDIGSSTPAEIAASILAEIIRVARKTS